LERKVAEILPQATEMTAIRGGGGYVCQVLTWKNSL